MANHSFVDLTQRLPKEVAEQVLLNVVQELWGDRLKVESYEGPDAEPNRLSWHVYVPNSGMPNNGQALRFMKAPEDDFGFVVWYHLKDAYWEFRHPGNMWERWAQDKVQQTIAQRLEVKTFRDEGDDTPQTVNPAGLKDTFRQYITRNFPEPHSAEDLAWFERNTSQAPEGFRE